MLGSFATHYFTSLNKDICLVDVENIALLSNLATTGKVFLANIGEPIWLYYVGKHGYNALVYIDNIIADFKNHFCLISKTKSSHDNHIKHSKQISFSCLASNCLAR